MIGELVDFRSTEALREVARTFDVAHREARRAGRPVLATWSRPVADLDPRSLLDRADRRGQRVFFWTSRWTGVELVGAGTAFDLPGSGAHRFQTVRRAWRRYATRLVSGGSGASADTGFPLLVGGFAFQPERWHP